MLVAVLVGTFLGLGLIYNVLVTIQKENRHFMSTTNLGLAALQAAFSGLQTSNAQIRADVAKLLANQQPGLQPGQVIVNQADIDALTASAQSETSADQATDATVNPPPTA